MNLVTFVLRSATHTDVYGNPHPTWYAVDQDGIARFCIKRDYRPHGWKGARSGTTQGQHYKVFHQCSLIGEFKRLTDAKALILGAIEEEAQP